MKKVNLENGNYAIVYYYNDANESVDESLATKSVVSEFDSNNKLIKEMNFVLNNNNFDNKSKQEVELEDNSEFPIIKQKF